MRHTLRETWSGLLRNLSMNFAVFFTIWVSLTLFGAGLLTAMQVDLIKGKWYDKIEISVFMCVKDSSSGNCDPGQDTTDAQRAEIKKTLEANPDVAEVFYESKQEAFEQFKEDFKDSPILNDLTVDQMQDSFRVKLKNPENYEGVVAEAKGLQGVQNVQDLRNLLDPIFNYLGKLQWATITMSGLLLLAATLQIVNTIRMAAFSRRRELGIMRLVGASNGYIMLPFILESLVAGLLGAGMACATLWAGYVFLIRRNAEVSMKALRWIEPQHVFTAMGVVALVAVLLSIIPTLIATKKYLRV